MGASHSNPSYSTLVKRKSNRPCRRTFWSLLTIHKYFTPYHAPRQPSNSVASSLQSTLVFKLLKPPLGVG